MYSILIVDDEIEILEGMRAYIPWSEIGFDTIYVAESGEKALDRLVKQTVNVVLLDIRMPGETGIDVARKIYEMKLPVMVLMFSAYSNFEYAQQAMSYGVRHYILKSTHYSDLLDILKKVKNELDEANGGEACGDSYKERIEHILKQYIAENLRNATLDGAASAVKKSVSFTSAFFKKQTGAQFGEYLQQQRMKKAVELLTDVRLKTYRISELVGYSTSKSFTRTFRKFYGMTPREWRGHGDST